MSLQVALDTSCIINLLSHAESPDRDLLQLVRHGLDGRIRLNVTPLVAAEVPIGDSQAAIERRGFIRQTLNQFPVADISQARQQELMDSANQLLSLLWPNAQEGSRKRRNSLADCKHLVSHRICGGDVFVTLDEALARKAQAHREAVGLQVLLPSEAIRLLTDEAPVEHRSSWSPVVRRARDDDKGEIRELLRSIRSTYDDFEQWLTKAISEKEIWIAQLDGKVGGVAVWSPKTQTSVKLATFFVGEEFEGRGLGPHLLFHQLRLWIERQYQKVFVTVSSERLSALTFFLTYGFRIEGSSARRYRSGATEFVLAKHLYYRIVDEKNFDEFVERVGGEIFDLPDDVSVRTADNWFLPPSFGTLRVLRGSDRTVTGVEIVAGDRVQRRIALDRFEELVYPARFAVQGRSAFLIPIRPKWADAMMRVPRVQEKLFASTDKLALRTDNAYYCTPRYTNFDIDGCPALFYISHPDKMIAGHCRIVERKVSSPEDLFLQYDKLGVYGLDSIRGHVRSGGPSGGCAMVIRFAWWIPFPIPVTLGKLKDKFALGAPMTIQRVDYSVYEKLLEAGGITW